MTPQPLPQVINQIQTGETLTQNKVSVINNEVATNPSISEHPKVIGETAKNTETPNKQIPSVRYDINYPIPDNAKTGLIDITFKDNAKIRFYLDKNTLISKAGLSLLNIISLINKYNPKVYGFDMSSVKSEEQTELKFEKEDIVSQNAANAVGTFDLSLSRGNFYN